MRQAKKKPAPGEGASFEKWVMETYTPRPFWGRGAQGASEGSIRGRKVVLAQHGHAAQQPFSENAFRRRNHGSANFDRSTQNRLWRENTRKTGFERCTRAQMNARPEVRVSRLKLGSV
jgi:hypothetical protein